MGRATCRTTFRWDNDFGRELNNSTVYGTKGTIRLKPLSFFEDQNGALNDGADRAPRTRCDSFELQLRNFLDAIAGRAQPINSADQALQLMEMLDAIYASSQLGREVPIA